MLTAPYLSTRLLRAAAQRDVEVLYACESGSRAWGLASTDSDYDVRFIYRHPRQWYLSLHPERDMIGPLMEDGGELDMAGWDVRKFLFHLANGNPGAIEWLSSPIVYHDSGAFLDDCRKLADAYFRPRKAIAHYLGIAHGARQAGFTEDGLWNLKKFCYWMRPILEATYVVRHGARPPITIEGLGKLIDDPGIFTAIHELIAVKITVKEDFQTRIDPALLTYFSTLKEHAKTACSGMDKISPPTGTADRFFRKITGWE